MKPTLFFGLYGQPDQNEVARQWWDECPNAIKNDLSIWELLAMYHNDILRAERGRDEL